MIERVKSAVFASGTGSNFEAIMNQKELACDVVLLVCDQPGAKAIEKAHKFGVKVFVADREHYNSKIAFEEAIITELKLAQIEWVFLAGYMRIVGETLLESYQGKIVNIHPSLLPEFPGIDAIGQAYDAGVKVTGVTVHFVDRGIDTGPIIAQEVIEVLATDTIDSLHRRIQTMEHKLYPRVINELINGGLIS